MTEEELKIKFDHIQGIFNRCINHASQVMIDNIASKSLYFDEEQADKLEQQEYVRTADELVQLYIRYSVLNDIQYFYSVSDFFWESGFYESLKSDEKRKYMSFNPLSFDYSRYEQDNTVYDEELASEEMINFVQLAINLGLKTSDIANHIFTHPTMSEALNDLFGNF